MIIPCRTLIFKTRNVIHKIPHLFTHTKAASKSKTKSYSSTILLPQTKLPLRLDGNKLIEREATITNAPGVADLYQWQRKSCRDPEFILHDGPPYANGTLHMGHAINKILKDTIIRSKIIQGQKVNYVPGWDCHGLPIELKAVSNTAKKLTPVEIRCRARNFAEQTIDKQKVAFKSWGVMGDWDNAYLTYDNRYIGNQMKKFYDLYTKKLVFRDVKPVYWSPSSRTALAEAELEYNEHHKSIAATVKLKVHHIPEALHADRSIPVYALIWTTTPWTLPSNQAVCFNPNLSYSIVEMPGASERFITATNLIDNLAKTVNSSVTIVNTFYGNLLNGLTYHHPLTADTILPFLPADHASETKGTGLVHTAPAHGPDDFLVALRNKLPILSLVNEAGCYTSQAGSNLEGLFVLSDGTRAVMEMIKQNVLHSGEYVHSYPYDWRTKQPVIIRSSKQWFIDTDAIKSRAIELLHNVEIIPKNRSSVYKESLVAQLRKRPYWCISRQRSWGVPIPVFYEASTGKTVLNREIIDHLCNLLKENGPDYWWNLPVKDLLPDNLLKTTNLSSKDVIKGEDIFDIWFDSGLSWSNVLGSEQVADLYLEGIDQFTGWFQSSLLTSLALRDKAPYKSVYVHGFVVDENGLKMSKSLGNVVDPLEIMQGRKGKKGYGIDTLRWWVVCHANSDSIAHLSPTVLQASADEVQKIRSVLRFAVGALFDYTEEQPVPYNNLLVADKYLLHLLWNFHKQVTDALTTYQFSKLSACVINFLATPVSALYYLAIKDRLYCNTAEDPDRKAAQYVLHQIFKIVTQSVAPVVPHLAEELYLHLPQKKEGSLFQNSDFCVNDTWYNPRVASLFENIIMDIKKEIHKTAGASTLDIDVEICASQKLINNFKEFQSDLKAACNELADILQVSAVNFVEDPQMNGVAYKVSFKKSSFHMCGRCRRVFAKTEDELCHRCNLVINDLENKNAVAI